MRTSQNDILEDDWTKVPSPVELRRKWGIIHRFVGDRERICRGRLAAVLVYYADPFCPVQISSIVEEQDVTFHSIEATSPRKTCRIHQPTWEECQPVTEILLGFEQHHPLPNHQPPDLPSRTFWYTPELSVVCSPGQR